MISFRDSELQAIGLRHKTVKAHPSLGYLPIYESLFGELRHKSFQLMELGAGPVKTIGASFYMWRDFFGSAQIIGIDNKEEALTVKDPRITVEIGDLGTSEFRDRLAGTYKPTIIVDDASHRWSHQITSFESLFPSLHVGGTYVVEDVHTSYGELRTSFGDHPEDAFAYFSTLSNLVCGRGEDHPMLSKTPATAAQIVLANSIRSIAFARRLIIVVKDAPRPQAKPNEVKN